MNVRFFSSFFFVFAIVVIPLVNSGAAEPKPPETNGWTQWRGPNRDSVLLQSNPWPENLDQDGLTRKWRVEVGQGYPGPVCDSERVYTASTIDRSKEIVVAFDRKTGQKVWSASWDGSMSVPFFARENGDWIRSTPTLDGDRIYVAGMRDVLVCLNSKTGKEIWKVDFVKKFGSPLPTFGFVCSPLIQGEWVYVQAGASLFKLDKMTGEEKWRTLKDEGGMNGSAFSSPVLGKFGGVDLLLVQTRSSLAGVDPQTGNVIWKKEIPTFRGMNILTPLVTDYGIYTSAYGGKSWMLNPKGSAIESVWDNKSEAYMSSPVLVNGHIYVHLRNQRFSCIEAATGKVKWTTTQSFGKYWSMVANGDKILALDQRGILRLIRANPEKFEVLSERKVSDQETWGHLAISGDEVLIRDLNGLSVWEWRKKS